ncbi:putative serine protease K12H4.7 [Trichoplusia ni]|uniref:Serine protease K12H4.7 n=1 Tax=Trichoplusia ni TaxID=7111 RepID=A0A7E5VQ21_TRINI|nr:putative serine protease K12H4.7 [Trichoplusia ni]
MFLKVFLFIFAQTVCQSLALLRNDRNIVLFKHIYLRSLTLETIEQKIDHFNESDHRTFRSGYYTNMHLFKPGGPIILNIGGEGAISPREVESTAARGYELLADTNPAYYVFEHRYYGESKPFENPTVDDLKYLSSKLALADVAHMIRTIKGSGEFNNSKVIVVGGSYAGNLAAWMKVLYPDLVDAAYASSGPVLAKKNFFEYFEVVTETIKTYGSQDCVHEISAKFNRTQELLQSPEGIKEIKAEHSICPETDMTVPENQQLLFLLLIQKFAVDVQYGDPEIIKDLCQEPILSLPLWYDEDDETNCRDLNYNTRIHKIYEDYSSSWLWLYQTCTEFGYFQTTTSNNQMFGKSTIPLEFYLKTCKVIFGDEFDEQRIDQGVSNTNTMYGGLTPNVENTVFVNGDMDPWHKLGVLHELAPAAPAVYIMGSSHCHDITADPDDDGNVKEARVKIENYLKKWIGA